MVVQIPSLNDSFGHLAARRPFQPGDGVTLRALQSDEGLNGRPGIVQGPGRPDGEDEEPADRGPKTSRNNRVDFCFWCGLLYVHQNYAVFRSMTGTVQECGRDTC